MPSKNPNYYQKAINATFYANPVKLQQLIDEEHLSERLLEDIGMMSKPFPIWRIPQCWEEAMGTDPAAYAEECREEVADFMARNHKVKEIFQNVFHIEYTPIDYQSYWEDFYATDPDDSLEDIFYGDSIEDLAKYGTTQLDMDLYCAVVKFDYPKVIELLKQGANPSVPTADEEYDGGSFDRIGMECSFLCTCQLSYAWSPKDHSPAEYREIGDLIGWAAHEKMYRILQQYNTHTVED